MMISHEPLRDPPFHPPGSPEGVPQQNRGLVNHVRIVAILMMVQAGLELMMGLFLVVMAVVMPFVVMQGMEQDPGVPQDHSLRGRSVGSSRRPTAAWL